MTTLAELEAAEVQLNAKNVKAGRSYRIVTISMYKSDVEELEAKVARLKARGWTNMSKSLLVRLALRGIDAETMEIPRR